MTNVVIMIWPEVRVRKPCAVRWPCWACKTLVEAVSFGKKKPAAQGGTEEVRKTAAAELSYR